MSGRRQAVAEFLPWAGLAASFAGLAVVHQWGSDGSFDSCIDHGFGRIAVYLLLGMLIGASGVIVSARLLGRDAESRPRRFVASLSLGAAALFAMAMLLPTIASALIPRCFG